MRWFWLPWLVAGDLWDDEMWHELATRAVRLGRESGALTVLPLALGYRAVVHLHAGEFAAAAALNEEADAITEATGNAPVKYPSLLLAAWRGVEAEALHAVQLDARERDRARRGTEAIGGAATRPRCSHNGLGRYEAALASARSACEYDDLGIFGFALVELVEAAARSGAHEEAAAALRRLEERTSAVGTDWALGVQAWSRALLSDGRGCRLPLPRGDRAARAQPHRRPSRPRAPGVRRVAASREPARRRPRAASSRARDVQPLRGRGVRRTRPSRAPGNGRDRAQPHRRDARRAHASGVPDRTSRPRRPLQPRDRRAAVHQPANRAVPPAQGLPEARHHLAQPAAAAFPAGRLELCRSRRVPSGAHSWSEASWSSK